MKDMLTSLLAGLVFGLGLTISGMVNPQKVLSFLDIAGAWDPSLLLVMGAAVTVTFIGYQLILKRSKPLVGSSFQVPTAKHIDRPLILGAIFFGLGWGLSGLCPGPALAALSTFSTEALVFVTTMSIGMVLGKKAKAGSISP